MMLKRILDFSHELLERSIDVGETVVDATCGNGKDTLVLSKLVGETGHVLAFDIQDKAIENTKLLITKNGCENVTYIHDGHENIKNYLQPNMKNRLGGAVFNLGYLPNSDKKIITKGNTTKLAIETLLDYLRKDALIVIVVYYGHKGGKEEKDLIVNYASALDQKRFTVLRYEFINQINAPPFIIAIQKK